MRRGRIAFVGRPHRSAAYNRSIWNAREAVTATGSRANATVVLTRHVPLTQRAEDALAVHPASVQLSACRRRFSLHNPYVNAYLMAKGIKDTGTLNGIVLDR